MSNQYPNDPYGRDQYGRDQYGHDRYRQDQTARYDSYPPSQAYSAADPGYPLPYQQPRPPSNRPAAPRINTTLFIGGVVMTGVVTALAAWLAAWILRTVVEKINATGELGVWNPMAQDEYWFAVAAFVCALAAAALWYVLQIVTPSPDQFFGWTVGLLIAAAVIIPLLLSQGWEVSIATALIHLVIGLPILTLIPTVGRKSFQP
ncbi:hypothetical protein HH308_07865 [Gordonia sp. TBRC 11910]|uniref:Uncharacterized protein n=1 Tax=Gordonia asplenii TaxID=2725283 RepID=A0A848KS92_9ACTN|nr:DUF6069 family protein [Gordonia asplenii]NMO01132.1 hypothetical protein [Gordonia asplenii]